MNNKNKIVKIFCEFIQNHPRQFILLFFILVIDGIVTSSSVLAILPLTDFLLDPTLKSPSFVTKLFINLIQPINAHPGYWFFGFLFAFSNVVKALVDVVIRYLILRIKYDIQYSLYSDSINTFFKARWQFFSNLDQGKLLNTFQKELANVGDTMGQLATQLARLVQLMIYLMIPMWVNLEMTVATIFLALIFGCPIFFIHKISYRFGKENIMSGNSLIGAISEIFSASKLIISSALQKNAQSRLLKAFKDHVHATLRSQTLESSTSLIYQPLGMLAVIIAFGFGLNQGSHLAEMAALLWALLRMLPILSQLMTSGVVINNFLPSYEQLARLREEAKKLEEAQGHELFTTLNRGVELVGINFSYPYRHKKQVINNINLKIIKGKITALVGRSGSGKSTIADIIMGLQVPDHGKVLIDGCTLSLFNLNSFRQRVGYVSQDPFLFNTSVRNNLLMVKPDATEKDLWAACELANAANFIKDFNGSLDVLVGERGNHISGGQRQRIALARALLCNPQLIILDEATSALDSESENMIQQSIEKIASETTVLIIAHRLSTIAKSDYIYVMEEGCIAEEGTYLDLSSKDNGTLAGLIHAQEH